MRLQASEQLPMLKSSEQNKRECATINIISPQSFSEYRRRPGDILAAASENIASSTVHRVLNHSENLEHDSQLKHPDTVSGKLEKNLHARRIKQNEPCKDQKQKRKNRPVWVAEKSKELRKMTSVCETLDRRFNEFCEAIRTAY